MPAGIRRACAAAAAKCGWDSVETDWRALIERDDIDLIDICTPGNTHAEIAIAALEAGKHVLCEKPLANSVEEAERMTAAADAAAGPRRVLHVRVQLPPHPGPGARQEDGRRGPARRRSGTSGPSTCRTGSATPNAPLTWRLDKTKSGSGALGDIGAHSIDAAQWITGRNITGVSALMETFVTERPLAGDLVGLGGHGAAGAERGPVTVDDAALFTARFDGAACRPIGIFEATRFALGRKNAMRLELNGTKGSLAFDFEDMNCPVRLRRRRRPRRRLPPDPRHRARAPLHR